MAKRGRKRIYKRYFDKPQEEAIVVYLNSDDPVEKNKIYEEFLKDPLYKMVESIINRYQLYSHELEFEDLLNDTLSFLHTKLDKFDPSKIGKNGEPAKAYSYYGTVIKHRLLGKRIKEQSEMNRKSSYETRSESIIQDERNSYSIEDDTSAMKEFFYEYVIIIENVLDKNEEEEFLKPNEEKIGYAVIHIMKEWESIFDEGGHKYNKNQVLECLRNMTGLTTKDIRDNLKYFKKIYYEKKKEKIDAEFNLNTRFYQDYKDIE